MNDNLYPIRLDLTREEGQILETLAIRECRVPHAQAHYLIRLKLLELGLLKDLSIGPITPPKSAAS
jgi:hypothetical protein